MEEKRRPKGLIITLIIIIVLLLAAVGYFVYDKYFTDSEVVNKETDDEEELSLTSTTVVDLEKKIASIGSYCDHGGYYFYLGNIYNSMISNGDKIASVISYLDVYKLANIGSNTELKEVTEFGGYEISNEIIKKVEQAYKELFGQDQEFVPGDSSSTDLSIVKVDGKYYLANMGCGNEYGVLDPTQKVIKYEKEIKIYKKVGYVFNSISLENIPNSALTTDLEGKNIIARLDQYDANVDETKYYTEKMNANIDKFDTYVFTFKLDTTGNYYFYSSELVK